MSSTNLDVFGGGTFVFEVEGTRFTVHKESVARVSKPLKAMIDNGMKGSQEGSEALEDTDKSTFCRFVEYLYTGDYNPSSPVPTAPTLPSEESDGIRSEEKHEFVLDEVINAAPSEEALWGFPSETIQDREHRDNSEVELTKVTKKGKKRKTKEKHISKEPKWSNLNVEIRTHNPLPTGSVFNPHGDWNQDYLPLFLSHAYLYVFADTYGIQNLQDLAASRLYHALSRFQYSHGSPTNIADLVLYAYRHTPDRNGEVDKLRTIVTDFCAKNYQTLRTSKSFLELLRSGGPFVPDLIWRM